MALVSEAEARALFGGSAERLEAIAGRFASPRLTPVRILAPLAATQGHPFEGELAQWIEVFERFEMEVADPAYAELRAPGTKLGLDDYLEKRGPSWFADLIGFFSAASVIVQQDEMSFLASWASTPGGSARVYYFHPSDWGLWPTDQSIAARLFRLVEEEEREEFQYVRFDAAEEARLVSALKLFEAIAQSEPLPPHLDPALLFARAEWLTHALLGAGRDIESAARRAAPLSAWKDEKQLARRWPHIATYWLWSHYFFDNRPELEDVFERTEHLASPVVAESRRTITKLRANEKVKLTGRDGKQIDKLRLTLARTAEAGVLGTGARGRLHERLATEEADNREAHAALAELEAVAEAEPLVAEALLLLRHLERGGAIPPGDAPVHGGLAVDAAMDRLAELMDPRFRPLVLTRLERAARVGDTHEDASWGLVLAWAHLAKDFREFSQEIARVRTAHFGPRRMTELYRAYGYFEDPAATRILATGARQWLDQMDDWIRMASDEPLIQLMKRDALETHELIGALLERATYSAANWDMCVRAAVAAGELKSKLALPGLKRAIARRLGRVDDGSRAKVVRALFLATGNEHEEFLRSAFEQRISDWESTDDEDDVYEYQKDIACHLAGLLPMAPEDERTIGVARTLLEHFAVKLGPRRRPRRDVIAAASSILSGIQIGEVRALRTAVAPMSTLSFLTSPSTRGAAEELRELASLVYRELAA